MNALLRAPIILSNKPIQTLKCHPQALRVILFQRWWWVFPTLCTTKNLGFLNHLWFLLQQKCPNTMLERVQLHLTAHPHLTQGTASLALKHGEAWAVFAVFKGHTGMVRSSGLTGTGVYLCPSRTVTACTLRHRLQAGASCSTDEVLSKMHFISLAASFWVTYKFLLEFVSLACASEKAFTTTTACLYCSINCNHLLLHLTGGVTITRGCRSMTVLVCYCGRGLHLSVLLQHDAPKKNHRCKKTAAPTMLGS